MSDNKYQKAYDLLETKEEVVKTDTLAFQFSPMSITIDKDRIKIVVQGQEMDVTRKQAEFIVEGVCYILAKNQ